LAGNYAKYLPVNFSGASIRASHPEDGIKVTGSFMKVPLRSLFTSLDSVTY
jgi:hypothetical protein